jgi:hypothetical protein
MQMKLVNGKTGALAATGNLPGIGIENVKKRLELLYPGRHELIITNDEDVFIVNMKIELEQKADPGLKIVGLPEHSHA